MGVVAEDRPKAIPSVEARLAISLKDALRAFREWNSSSTSLQIFFLGKTASSDAVRVSMNGVVTLIDPKGIVTVSGGGREIKLELTACDLSIGRNSIETRDFPQSLDSDPALLLRFPNGAICVVVPGPPDSRARHDSRTGGPFRWLRNKLVSPASQSNTVAKDPPAAPPADRSTKRNLCVDVFHGQANIVEILETGSGRTRIRRLKEQFLSRAERTHADQIKRKITYGENGGTYELDGLYSPRSAPSLGDLLHFVELLERKDGPMAWDRRRYPR